MKNIFLIISVFIVFISCNDDPFVDYKLPYHKTLYFSGFVTNDSISIILKNNTPADPSVLLTPSDIVLMDTTAIISVYENGVYFEKLSFINDTFYDNGRYTQKVYYYSNKKTTEGNIYSIEVNLNGYDKLFASACLPKKIPVNSFDTTCRYWVMEIYSNGTWHDTSLLYTEVKATFTDPSYSNNYYLVDIKDNKAIRDYQYNFIKYNPIYDFEKFEELIYINRYSFSDKNIQGKNVELKYDIIGKTDSVAFCLISINEDYYKYYQSLIKYTKARADNFSEPVSIYSNVSNGMGIFVGFSTTYFTLPKREE